MTTLAEQLQKQKLSKAIIMLQGYEIIVFSDELGRHPFSCQHIMKYFSPANRLIWITPTGMRNPKFSLYDVKRAAEKLKKFMSSPEILKGGDMGGIAARQLIPFALPFNNITPVRMINNRSVTVQVKKTLDRNSKRIVITTLPITAEYIDHFEAETIVYYIVDDFLEWPGINQRYMARLEKILIGKANLLIASAERLCQLKKGKAETVCIPHGVEYELFSSPSSAEPPASLAAMKHPIIGFFGAISPWLDFPLIAAAALNRPGYSFVFIGPVDADVTQLKALSNIHFLGKVDYVDLPNYAHQFDVGIIPFVINELTVSVNPLKLLEYFACGLPVVSTPLPEVCKYGDLVLIAKNDDEFVACLDRALQGGEAGRAMRQQLARENSWRSVAERFSTEIERSLGVL